MIVDLTDEAGVMPQLSSDESAISKWKPFYLLKSDGVEEQYNINTLSFSDLFCGEFTHAMLANFHMSVPFMRREAPRL